MNKSIMPFLVVLAVLSLAGIIFLSLGSGSKKETVEMKENVVKEQVVEEQSAETEVKEATGNAQTGKSDIKTVEVTGTNYAFSPKEIKVAKGDTVKIVFVNKEGLHDFVIDELKVKTKQISAGKTETAEFTADKTGTFEYYCNVGTHRQMGMWGKLIVSE